MSYIADAMKLLADLPVAEIARARVDLALDRLAQAEQQISVLGRELADCRALAANLAAEKERLNSALEEAKRQQQLAEQNYREIQQQHSEEVRIAAGVEFRRGARTGGVWLPFCPICRAPIVVHPGERDRVVLCSSSTCTWSPTVSSWDIETAEVHLSMGVI